MICLALRGVFGFVGIAFSFLAIQTTSLANSQVTAQTTPVFTAILSSVFLREPWRVPEIMATIAATVGVVLVFQPTFIFGDRRSIHHDSRHGYHCQHTMAQINARAVRNLVFCCILSLQCLAVLILRLLIYNRSSEL